METIPKEIRDGVKKRNETFDRRAKALQEAGISISRVEVVLEKAKKIKKERDSEMKGES